MAPRSGSGETCSSCTATKVASAGSTLLQRSGFISPWLPEPFPPKTADSRRNSGRQIVFIGLRPTQSDPLNPTYSGGHSVLPIARTLRMRYRFYRQPIIRNEIDQSVWETAHGIGSHDWLATPCWIIRPRLRRADHSINAFTNCCHEACSDSRSSCQSAPATNSARAAEWKPKARVMQCARSLVRLVAWTVRRRPALLDRSRQHR